MRRIASLFIVVTMIVVMTVVALGWRDRAGISKNQLTESCSSDIYSPCDAKE